jgi:EAL domain-containing protein (putative c-di-GMP-specific phosphodiesterase class I)
MAPFNSVSAQYILENLDNALEQQHVKVYFQPVIRTVSRQMCSMEALARWEDPEYGLLPPAVFIPVLEQHGLIHLLDSHVIWQVCALYREAVSRGDLMKSLMRRFVMGMPFLWGISRDRSRIRL